MDSLYIWIENSALSVWLRESPSLFAFPAVLILHTIGMAFLVGISAAMSLRILGFAPRLPLSSLEKCFPVLWISFIVNFLSGVGLLVAFPAKAMTNPLFYAKLVFILLGFVNIRLLRTRIFRDPFADTKPVSFNARVLAVTSLFFWLGATTLGRLLAYTYSTILAR